mmetsp:Transcript_36884/g.61091  ORF Transcript_36884/g.61091 Transcript_36884/m.61091 type:complete len:293 (-) Transcript_36884:288-1166(-)|eukprot:CAMPEP_0119314726 /NCGR_PEP_ID=MMETSP1333-20130426/33823_1 /TAXON_ID=418940 /ORGANISM="Scyphosphaera apsteinii, Strain RCC1455" /LENGTH=292 /DNA_ID=CAMNT_0007319907 /DNA_START=38 /DNA_END=916 /DNA_ORIENTATION=-
MSRAAMLRRAMSGSTHFGYRTVPEADKERLVGHVFDSVAGNYNLMNDLMSAGVHRLWKDTFVHMLGVQAMKKLDLQVLDVAGGTGDIAFRLAEQISLLPTASSAAHAGRQPCTKDPDPYEPDGPRIVVSDINKTMLEVGRQEAAKLHRGGRAPNWPRMEWVVADAQQLPFEDCSFDVYMIAFGIRNVTRIEEALREAHRVLRPGGRFMCLEFSRVTNPLLRAAYEQYSFQAIPRIGAVVAKDRASYQYLVESIQRFPDQETFSRLISSSGLRCVQHTNLTFGVVAIHSAIKL